MGKMRVLAADDHAGTSGDEEYAGARGGTGYFGCGASVCGATGHFAL